VHKKQRRIVIDPRYFLIWSEVSDRNWCHREFPNIEILNDFLSALDPKNIVAYKILSGFTLREVENNLEALGND